MMSEDKESKSYLKNIDENLAILVNNIEAIRTSLNNLSQTLSRKL